MSCNKSRQQIAAHRLRKKLRKNRESLADEFEFKMYVNIHFKHEAKKNAIFEIGQLYPMMTNDFEHKLPPKENENNDLISNDIVQLHARKWQTKRRDVIGRMDDIDLMIWPRDDISAIQCQLFSRWRCESSSPFRPYDSEFTVNVKDYEAKLRLQSESKQSSRCVVTNPEQTVFLFVSQHDLDQGRGLPSIFRLNSLCIFLPQAELINWGRGTMEEIMEPILRDV